MENLGPMTKQEECVLSKAFKEFITTIGFSLLPFLILVVLYIFWNDFQLSEALDSIVYSGDLLIYGVTISGPIIHAICREGSISYKGWLFFGWILVALISLFVFSLIKPVSISTGNLNQQLVNLILEPKNATGFIEFQNLAVSIKEYEFKHHQKELIWYSTWGCALLSLLIYYIYLVVEILDKRKKEKSHEEYKKSTDNFVNGYSRNRGNK